jgi:predicted acylesterase/phospholipase RssA
MTKNNNAHRDKLGLALAGGGFRASLFHIGVLRRMAELDMLRYVEVLSTVSGGSIVGALYILLLKRELDKKARLDQADYLLIVRQLEQRMARAVKKNLRVRLFLNPFGILRFMLSEYSLGRRMSRLYERCIYNETVRELEKDISVVGWTGKSWVPTWLRRLWAPGRICLNDIKMYPGGQPITDGIESYNRSQVEKQGSVITQLILNATSLNSGARFWFSSTEIGDWDHGNIRRDEIDEILKRKQALAQLAGIKTPARIAKKIQAKGKPLYFTIAGWWHKAEFATPVDGLESLFDDLMTPVIALMCKADLGKLRMAKLPAWYLRKGASMIPPITGGITTDQHLNKVAVVIGEIGHIRRDSVDTWLRADKDRCNLMLDFIYELFILRLAENVSPNISKDWNSLTLGEAVGASANFPPVFPPFQITGIYDDIVVSRLGLTDGGLFDNIGITGLLDEHCNHIIASDTGIPLNPEQRSSTGRIGMSTRAMNILMNREITMSKAYLLERHRISAGLGREADFIMALNSDHAQTDEKKTAEARTETEDQQLSLLYADNEDNSGDADQACNDLLGSIHQRIENFHSTYELHSLAMFNIDSNEIRYDKNAPVAAKDLARVRTDMDAFGDIEMYALMNQGYANADHYIRRYMNPQIKNGVFTDPKDRSAYNDHPYPYNNHANWQQSATSPWHASLCQDCDLVRRTIKVARHRFFRALRMRLMPAWFATLAIAACVLWFFRDTRVSVDSFLNSLGAINLRQTYSIFAYLPDDWSGQSVNLVVLGVAFIVSVLVFILLGKYRFTLVDKLKSLSWFRLSRWAARLARWPQSYKGNLLWAIWLPLPVVIAVGLSATMWFSHLCYRFPLLYKTRLHKKYPD